MPEIIEKISAARDTFFRANGFMPNTIKMSMADYRQLCEWARLAQYEVINPATGEAIILNPLPEKLDKIFGMRIVKRAGDMECAFEPSSDVSKPDTNKFFDKLIGAPGSNKPIVMKRDFSSCRHGIPSINCTECSVAPKIDLRDAIRRDDPTGGYGACVHGNDVMTCAKCIPPIANKESVDKEIDLAKKFCKAEYDAAPKELDPGILPYPKPIIERKEFSGGEENIKIPMPKNLTGGTTFPESPLLNDAYFDTANNQWYAWNGDEWIKVFKAIEIFAPSDGVYLVNGDEKEFNTGEIICWAIKLRDKEHE